MNFFDILDSNINTVENRDNFTFTKNMETLNQSGVRSQWGFKGVALVLAILVTGVIISLSIIRDRIVSPQINQVTVVGRGVIPYESDMAVITVGVQIDKAPTPEEAYNQLNGRVARIISALSGAGVSKESIQTLSYTVTPQYDFRDNVSVLAGYNANQQISVKVQGSNDNAQQVSRVISEVSKAGANQILGISFNASNISELKQKARMAAIEDARKKAPELASTAGVRFGRIVSWYESVLQEPGQSQQYYGYGAGAGGSGGAAPQVPSGTQEVVIEVGLNYVVK